MLTGSELARAERFRFELDRKRWTRARTILRSLLGTYLGLDPHIVEITAGDHGKPTLVPQRTESIGNASRLQFNLSHSGDLVLYAFAIDNPVGVDVEVARGPIDEASFPWAIVGEHEAARLRAFRGVGQQRELLRAWVRTEAALKCRGTGLGAGLQGDDADSHPLWLVDLDVGSRAAAALAVTEAPARVRVWEWS